MDLSKNGFISTKPVWYDVFSLNDSYPESIVIKGFEEVYQFTCRLQIFMTMSLPKSKIRRHINRTI